MSSSSNTEPRITTPQPDPNMNRTSPEHEFEMLTPQATQATTQEKLIPPPTTVKSQQRTSAIQPRSSQSNPKSSKAQAGEKTEKIQKEDIIEKGVGADENDESASLDWVELEHRYRAALIQVNNAEDGFNQEFDSYADAFQIWSQTSAHEDNERAQKRIKTRIAFVQLSEAALENKRQNYVNVVQAFKTALDLLKQSSSLPMR